MFYPGLTQISRITVKKFVTTATWRLGVMHFWANMYGAFCLFVGMLENFGQEQADLYKGYSFIKGRMCL
jgi:hypothetical protein